MVAVSDFSGLASSIWAFASAPAIAPIVSLERCMTGLLLIEIKADGAGFGSLGPDTMPDGLLGILWHQLLQFDLGGFMIEERSAGMAKDASKFRPGIGRAHVDDPDRLDPRPWCLDAEQMRGLAGFHAAPELLLCGEEEMLVERIGRNRHLDPF